ncbi:MAG: DUF3574 domain-containing protein [Ignavibacteria bacterium]
MQKRKILFAIISIITVSVALFAFRPADNNYTKTELYFGQSKNTGGKVSQEEWNAFEDSVIVKVFSSGSTTFETRGRWLNENGDVIKEDSRIVMAVNKMTPELSAEIDSIREKYKKYFSQSSVLRIDQTAEVSF